MDGTSGSPRRAFLAAGPGAALALAGCGGGSAPGVAQAAQSTLTSKVSWSTAGSQRTVLTNQVPDHDNVGPFPDFADPFPLREVPVELRMPLVPTLLAQAKNIDQSRFGVALNGILLDPAGPWWRSDVATGWQFEVMSERIRHYIGIDASNGHVQPNGAYHYHGMPERYIKQRAKALVQWRSPGVDSLLLIGWAADGHPIYRPFVPDTAAGTQVPARELRPGYRLKSGLRPAGSPRGTYDGTFVQDYVYSAGAGDLDECNGLYLSATPEFPNGTYAYFVTRDFPHIPRKWRAQPDQTFFVSLGAVGADEAPPQYAGWPAA
jgi:hypothetical protein